MSSEQSTILQKILQRKREEIAAESAVVSEETLVAQCQTLSPCRGFIKAIQNNLSQGRSAVIAEVKKASPSKGVIRENFDPATIAAAYEQGGASCLSVLTDRDFFQGCNDYLRQARQATSLPVIRKDFIIDSYQVNQARALEADCILLIMSAFEGEQTLFESLYQQALGLGMDVLIEIHNEAQLQKALQVQPSIIGINNRNLHTFETSLQTTINLLARIPEHCIVVTESGIHNKNDITLMRDNAVNSFLVGEAFMRADDPGKALQQLFFS